MRPSFQRGRNRALAGLCIARSALLWFAAILCAAILLAQTAEVTRNVNLRSDPSSDNPPIRLLTPPEQVELLEPDRTGGYYHVRTSAGEEGWVWSRNVRVLEGTPTPTPATGITATPTPAPIGAPTATTTPAPSGPAASIDPSWDKPNPVEITFNTISGTCGPDGDPTGDTETYHRKNHVDLPSAYHEVSFDAIAGLSVPHVHTTRASWTPADRTLANSQIVPFEGVAVSVVGFLVNNHPNVGVKVEGAEKTNCRFTAPTEVDWHMPLAPQSNQPEKTAIVVETTPRVRKDHPGWTTAKLNPLVNTATQVRISGWLMFDPDHPPHLGVFRTTLWEIHPVTRIEVSRNGSWVDLDMSP